MPMKPLITLLLAACCTGAAAQSPLDWGDQLNGTYKNPVLNADYSDPDVIRVGDRYYMVASDFHFLGMQMLESADLLHWRIVSQLYDRFELPGWDANGHYGGGSWAPALRHHDGRFYVYFCTPDEGLFMTSAAKAEGPWEPLHCVKAVEKWEDPCPLWDDDGQAYLGRSRHRAGPIIVHRMSGDGRQLLDDGVTVYTGPVAEGTKFLKRHGHYYLIIPEGGVGQGWQTVLRSRSVYGPYEKRVVLEQGSTAVNGPHQGALVDVITPRTPAAGTVADSAAPLPADTTWWFLHFQETHPCGRVVHLQPARWKDGWPLMGADIDGNGIGEPLMVWQNPLPSTVYPPSTLHPSPSTLLTPLSDDFRGDSLCWVGHRQRALGPQWQWNHNPVDSAWSLSVRRGWLSLLALPAASLKEGRGQLSQKTVGYQSLATTRLDASQLSDGDHAGLLCTGRAFMAVGVCREQGRLHLYTEADGQRTIVAPCKGRTVWLRADIDSRSNSHRFLVSTDGRQYTPVGQPFPLTMGYWKGSRVGLYCYTTAHRTGGKALFDWFNYEILK